MYLAGSPNQTEDDSYRINLLDKLNAERRVLRRKVHFSFFLILKKILVLLDINILEYFSTRRRVSSPITGSYIFISSFCMEVMRTLLFPTNTNPSTLDIVVKIRMLIIAERSGQQIFSDTSILSYVL